MKIFDFARWLGVTDEDNHADDYYAEDEAYIYCDECDNLMVPYESGDSRKYKCPVCGNTNGSL